MKENIIMLYPHVCFHYHFKKAGVYRMGFCAPYASLGPSAVKFWLTME